ncbi:GatB YqeY domain-containing protein [Mycena rosella]|uniref:Altered inheritance of mitochondria protein 41 n=1 Tax=Mycena rosella TaxID=1033263 RepID=A0AAD7D5K8_MYCRO|nr:GatB YqeY domain-containing protein [Mycena rosella]
MAAPRFLYRPTLRLCRAYSIAQTADVRTELVSAVKAAMKSKDAVASTTLRGVLAEVYSADKAANTQVPSTAIITILRKAAARRNESAAQYTAAARLDLAERENLEVKLLSRFLPPLLSEADIDKHLREILDGLPKPPKPGQVFKLFYSIVDKSTVDSEMVKKRLDVLLNGV